MKFFVAKDLVFFAKLFWRMVRRPYVRMHSERIGTGILVGFTCRRKSNHPHSSTCFVTLDDFASGEEDATVLNCLNELDESCEYHATDK